DSLTGLPNRILLEDRVTQALLTARRNGARTALLFLDLDRFKVVNDSLGHDKGDALLKTVAARLRDVVREGDTVARLGGDEFVILLENVGSIDDISAIAESALDAVRVPMRLDGHEVSVSTSIGASVYPKDGADASTLLKHADTAMYRAKEVGQGVFRFYDADMNIKVLERLLTENGLRQAIDKGHLVLHYQPRLLVASHRICGAEALIRWQHPEKGLIPPSDFVPLAEEIGLINKIGEWVLRTACRQAQVWRASGIAPFRVSVNLSARQVVSEDLVGTVCAALRDSGLDPEWLELELTESSLIDGLDATTAALRQLRAAGVSIAIDDFGTGYSSLSYLKQLPIDALKIDRSFLSGVPFDRNDTAIVNATIVMAHQMGLRVIAEGVNTGAQIGILCRLGCDEMQGYELGRPMTAGEFAELLMSQAPAATE
ncbi:MAG: putative bifunctional diguanylate cyclase/phosphodiesterase, partial [Burkholderiaceae bacterium]